MMLIIFCEKSYIHISLNRLKMKKVRCSIIFVTALLLLHACSDSNSKNNAPVGRLASCSWILGNWYMDTPRGQLIESWQKVSDTMLSGYSIMRAANGDTLFSEKIKIVQRGDTLWYIPLVSNQNNGEEVPFKEISCNTSGMIFENPTHDFPQRIIYRHSSDSTLFARIEGMENGVEKASDFPYRRSK